MSVNEWWAGDGRERYWMEITNRADIGADLLAPKRDDAGREYWSYALVNHVQPGDIVFHWDKNQGPAIIGYSVVTALPRSSTITWQSRGTYGRTHAPTGQEPAWRAPLGAFVPLSKPVTQERLRQLEDRVAYVRERLDKEIDGPIYFPFALSDKRALRAAQGYLTKFPRRLGRQFPNSEQHETLVRTSQKTGASTQAPAHPTRQGGRSTADACRMPSARRQSRCTPSAP